ncbi:MAG: nitrogen fixation protein NifZ [Acidobacteriaceae bacterium]
MMEAGRPGFEWGQRVEAAVDLFNDGSYPERPADALLVGAGEPGEIVQVGRHVDSGAFVYMVEFPLNRVVGCMEPELMVRQPDGEAQ